MNNEISAIPISLDESEYFEEPRKAFILHVVAKPRSGHLYYQFKDTTLKNIVYINTPNGVQEKSHFFIIRPNGIKKILLNPHLYLIDLKISKAA
jgi:hypothetical protein